MYRYFRLQTDCFLINACSNNIDWTVGKMTLPSWSESEASMCCQTTVCFETYCTRKVFHGRYSKSKVAPWKHLTCAVKIPTNSTVSLDWIMASWDMDTRNINTGKRDVEQQTANIKVEYSAKKIILTILLE